MTTRSAEPPTLRELDPHDRLVGHCFRRDFGPNRLSCGPAPVRACWLFATSLILMAVLASLLLRLSAPAVIAGPAALPPIERLVAVTEDIAVPYDGCDAISVFDIETGEAIHRGPNRPSVGRLTARPDLTLLIASASYSAEGSPLYVMNYDPGAAQPWTTWPTVRGPVSGLSGLAILPDGDAFLAGGNGEAPSYFGPPYWLASYRLSQMKPDLLGPEYARFDLTANLAEIILSPDGKIAHTITRDAVVESLNALTLTRVAEPIQLEAFSVEPNDNYYWPLNVVHATVTADGRYLITNRWDVPEINVADVVTRQAWTVHTGNRHNGGVAVNRGWKNPGLVALHAWDAFVVYRFEPPSTLTELGRLANTAPEYWAGGNGPKPSIAWSGDGQYIVASFNQADYEFAVIRVTDDGRTLRLVRRLAACIPPRPTDMPPPFGNVNEPNDIWTANGLITPPPPTTTLTPTPSTTPTVTRTPTSNPATATPAPRSIFLPVLVSDPPCDPARQRADIVLVLDTSLSMAGRKLADAQAAARTFVDLLELAPGSDQVAIVQFDSEAEVVQSLTIDRDLVDKAIAGLVPREGTFMDRGLSVAVTELTGPRHRPGNARVVVLLTDGVQTGGPSAALAAAERARSAGVMLYTIGLGADADGPTLETMATDPRRYRFAPDSTDLAAIYADIAGEIRCPGEGRWPWGERKAVPSGRHHSNAGGGASINLIEICKAWDRMGWAVQTGGGGGGWPAAGGAESERAGDGAGVAGPGVREGGGGRGRGVETAGGGDVRADR